MYFIIKQKKNTKNQNQIKNTLALDFLKNSPLCALHINPLNKINQLNEVPNNLLLRALLNSTLTLQIS